MIPMTPEELRRRHIRRSQYVSCNDAFIDVRLPGSSPKENYSIIGPGVTQNPGQVINLREPHGFNIGAAGLQPGITNNLHLHFTAEVFIICEGRFRLRWGVTGDEGEVDVEPGDVVCMPPWMFRGFSNCGSTYGFLMTVLGGDDTGGIIWSPDVMQRARQTGLWLSKDNRLIEVSPGAPPPSADTLLPLMPQQDVKALRRWTATELLARCVRRGARDWRRATLDSAVPGHGWELAPVAGWGLSQHRDQRPAVAEPLGFSLDWLRVPPGQRSAPFLLEHTAVLIHEAGPLRVVFDGQPGPLHVDLGAWDTLSVPAGTRLQFVNLGDVAASALLVVQGDARKVPRFDDQLVAQAASHDAALDAGGHLARLSLLPPGMLA